MVYVRKRLLPQFAWRVGRYFIGTVQIGSVAKTKTSRSTFTARVHIGLEESFVIASDEAAARLWVESTAAQLLQRMLAWRQDQGREVEDMTSDVRAAVAALHSARGKPLSLEVIQDVEAAFARALNLSSALMVGASVEQVEQEASAAAPAELKKSGAAT